MLYLEMCDAGFSLVVTIEIVHLNKTSYSDIPVHIHTFNYQSINQSINLLVEPGTNISRDEVQSVEQQDIQGSQGALTVAFETLSNKHKMKT